MKHTLYITAIAAVALMLCGCQRESLTDIVGSQSDDVVKFVPTLSGGSGDARSKGTLYNESNSPVSLGKYFSEFMVVAWNSTPEERVIPDKYALGEDADHGFASAGYISGDGVNGYYQKVVRRNKTDYDATDNPNAQYWMTVQPQTSSASGAPEQADDEYIWKSGETKTFFAYANLPQNGATMANTASSQTLTYTEVPADASDQADILLGFYKGNGGGTGTAGIVFYHPLTAVKFIRGEMDESLKIKSISLEGVASRGTAKMEVVKPAPNMDETVNITWNYIGTYSHTVSQSAEAGLSVDATSKLVGEPFIIIPQNVVKNEVNVTVTLTDGTSGTTTIPAGDTGEWQAGKTNTYTLNYGDDTGFTLSITPWDENAAGDVGLDDKDYLYEFKVADSYMVFSNTTSAQTKTFQIESYRHEKGDDIIANREPVAFSAEYSTDGGQNWLPFDASATTATGISGLKATGNDGAVKAAPVSLAAAAKTESGTASEARWVNDGILASNWDLSRMQIGGEGDGTAERNTANCYIVKHPGTYILPCVYGNSIQNGVETDKGYKSTIAVGTANVLSTFLNAAGNGIVNAWVLQDLVATVHNPKAALLWTDAKENDELLVHNVKLVNASGADFNWATDAGNQAYIRFQTADKANMVHGNAVVVLYDDKDSDGYEEGEALWSWHLWLTDADLSTENTGVVSNDVKFMSRNLGWCDGAGGTVYKSSAPNVLIRLTQEHSSNKQLVTVFQHDAIAGQYTTYGNCCFYQHGRKDPFVGTKEGAGFQSGESYGNGKTYYYESGTGKDQLSNGGMDILPNSNWKVCLPNSIRYPFTYAIGDKGGGYDNQFFNLWAINNAKAAVDITTGKTVYDPSPYGYVVPDEQCFSTFTADNASFDDARYVSTFKNNLGALDDNLIFPACGCRYYTGGNIFYHIGYIGDYWSASVNSTFDGYCLYTVVSESTVKNGQYFRKAHGFPVRPILEK